MANSTVELSVVIPIMNDAASVKPLLRRLVPTLEGCAQSFEVIFVIDPSDDGTEDEIDDASASDDRIWGLVLSRRFGQAAATIAGLENCSGAAAVVMDCDLQDPPELITEMILKWRQGNDVVYARRLRREGETAIKKIVSKLGYLLIYRLSEVKIPRDTGDFRLMSRRVIEHLVAYPESHGFLKGLVALVGFSQVEVTFVRPARHAGHGHYNRYFGALRPQFHGIVAFSTGLLNFSTVFGLFAAATSLIMAFVYGLMKVKGFEFPIGNPTIVILILLVGGTQLVCLGIIGQYIGRIYDEVKRRPKYIVDYYIGKGPNSNTPHL